MRIIALLSLLPLTTFAIPTKITKTYQKLIIENAQGIAATTIYNLPPTDKLIAAAEAPGTTIYKLTPQGTTIYAAAIPQGTTIYAAVVADESGVPATTILKEGVDVELAQGTTIYAIEPHGTTIYVEPVETPEALWK